MLEIPGTLCIGSRYKLKYQENHENFKNVDIH